MTRFLPAALLAAASLFSGSAALAATQTTAKKTMTTTSHVVAKPAAMHTTGRMVTTKTSTGKTVTYDCSKAGNATKTACKK